MKSIDIAGGVTRELEHVKFEMLCLCVGETSYARKAKQEYGFAFRCSLTQQTLSQPAEILQGKFNIL